MSTATSSHSSGGIGFLGLLTILFIGLKLTNFITWSWWLVLLPMYIVPAALLVTACGFGTIALSLLGALAILAWYQSRRARKLAA